MVHYAGVVHDDQTRSSILDALKAAYGTDKIAGDISVDANRAVAPWLANFRAALDPLKVPGVEAAFEGGSVNVGGAVMDADREKIIASLKSVLGGGLAVGVMADKMADLISGANAKATSALAGLTKGFGAKDVTAALNQSIINFPSNGAEVPTTMAAFLDSAAGDVKQLPAGSVLEIAGYPDSSGDADANVTLSQKRADAVRDLLVKAGARPTCCREGLWQRQPGRQQRRSGRPLPQPPDRVSCGESALIAPCPAKRHCFADRQRAARAKRAPHPDANEAVVGNQLSRMFQISTALECGGPWEAT